MRQDLYDQIQPSSQNTGIKPPIKSRHVPPAFPPSPVSCNQQQLEPLPELPDTSDDRFFSKEALDYQWPSVAVDTPPFPTWGSTGAEMAAISSAAEPTAPITAPATTATTSTVTIPPSPTGGTKCPLSNPSFQQQQQQQSQQQVAAPEHQPPKRPSVAADRTVFLRQRLGGESLSSGNSSTSTCSDTASDDVSGDWEAGSGRGNTTSRAKSPVAGVGASKGTAAGGVGSSSGKKSARKKRKGSGPTSKERRRKSESHTSASKADIIGSVGGIGEQNERGGRYTSWDALVRPYKQQWDHIELPSEESEPEATETAKVGAWQTTLDDHGGEGGGESKCGGLCSRFSAQPLPGDPTAFSVEQCSAQAHPTAVASYVLRVRCGGGAHIVRRTWDDLATLCTMLGTTPPPASDVNTVGSQSICRSDVQGDKTSTNHAASTVSDAVAAVAAATAAAVTDSGLGRPAATPNGLEFAPADVLGRNAASGFLRDLLERPGMIWATPTRRFLELEYLDGTLRGGTSDDRREKAARQVASLAASAASPAVFPATLYQGTPQRQQQQQRSSEMDTSTTGGFKSAFQGGPLPSQGLTVGAPPAPNIWPVAAAAQRSALIFSAHPNAARDLAAVCRCLGELGATAFTSKALLEPAASSSVPSPSSSSAAATTRGDGRSVEDVAPQRVSSMAVLA